MTLEELRSEIWVHTGEQTDLYPSSVWAQSITDAVNEGVRHVATWKDPRTGRVIRYPGQVAETFFQTYYLTGTLDADGTTTTVVFPAADVSATDDAYVGWVVEIGNESAFVVDYVGSTQTATLSKAITAPESGDTYELSKSFVRFLASSHALISYHFTKPTGFLLPQLVIDLEDDRRLIRRGRTDASEGVGAQLGTPTEWDFRDDRIVFNYAAEESRWYKMEYTKLPAELTTSSDVPDLPDYLHYGIFLWGRWWGYSRIQGHPEAYSAKKDFEDFMQTRSSMYAFAHDREVIGGVLRIRG